MRVRRGLCAWGRERREQRDDGAARERRPELVGETARNQRRLTELVQRVRLAAETIVELDDDCPAAAWGHPESRELALEVVEKAHTGTLARTARA